LEDGTKKDLKELGCEDVNWMPHERFQWRAVVNAVTNPRVILLQQTGDYQLLENNSALWSQVTDQ
jgi:hypothetical protein